MAVALEFIDFVVRIETIRSQYPGGWEQCLADHARLIGHRVWYDDHLFRDGAMSPGGIGRLFEEWSALGFVPTEAVRGNLCFKDVCVVEAMLGGTTLPCDWLVVDTVGRLASIVGTPPGAVAGRKLP